MKGWQLRYVTVQDKKLKYFKNQGDKLAAGVLNFDHFECNIKLERTLISLKMNGTDRVFEFKAESEESAKHWVENIEKHITESEGFKEKKSSAGLKKPWRFDHVSSS